MDWLSSNYQLVSSLSNIGMFVIWALYLHLFFSLLRRHKRATILINISERPDWDGRCLVSNMSAEPVYIESVLLSVEFRGSGSRLSPITDVIEHDPEAGGHDGARHQRGAIGQGPVLPGQVIDIGGFRSMAMSVLASADPQPERPGDPLEQVEALEVHIIAVYAAEDFLCGARRRFGLKATADRRTLKPTTWYTHQTRAHRDRKRLAELLDEDRRMRFD